MKLVALAVACLAPAAAAARAEVAAPVAVTLADLATFPEEDSGYAHNGLVFVTPPATFPAPGFVVTRVEADGSETPVEHERLRDSEVSVLRVAERAVDEAFTLRLRADADEDGVADDGGETRDLAFFASSNEFTSPAAAPTDVTLQNDLENANVRVVTVDPPGGTAAILLLSELDGRERTTRAALVAEPGDRVTLRDFVDDAADQPFYRVVAVSGLGEESDTVDVGDQPSGYAGCTNVAGSAPAAAAFALALALLARRRRRSR